jgi:ABC-type transport system involved in multi-copper enzyme maturation permease subunit
MWPFTKAKNMFGPPRWGVHKYRIFNISLVDLALALFLGYIFNIYLFPEWNYLIVMVGTFLLGIFLHRLFGVKTTIDRLLFKRWYKKTRKERQQRKENELLIIWDDCSSPLSKLNKL